MSQFSGRQTDSHGLARTVDHKGDLVPKQPHQLLGTAKSGGNKGVMATRREIKRAEAEERNARTPDHRRRGGLGPLRAAA